MHAAFGTLTVKSVWFYRLCPLSRIIKADDKGKFSFLRIPQKLLEASLVFMVGGNIRIIEVRAYPEVLREYLKHVRRARSTACVEKKRIFFHGIAAAKPISGIF